MDYDLLVVGGGLAGASIATAMARTGARVLVAEREPVFRDRVRGEAMQPWGGEEARALGIIDRLLAGCAHQARWLTMPDMNRDLVETTPARLGFLDFHHPEMQQCLLDLAVETGAELLRPAEVAEVVPGDPPTALVRTDGAARRVRARLIIGADGRNSRVRTMAGFRVERDPEHTTIAGTLYRGLHAPQDAVQLVANPPMQALTLLAPIGGDRFRAYAVYRAAALRPMTGERDLARFVDLSVATGARAEWFRNGVCIGPLASFNAPDAWAPHPYRDGVVLIGDAAAASDPVWGCGLALTLRDVRVLRDGLMRSSDWQRQADAYAVQHDHYFGALHDIHGMWNRIFFEAGPDADALRERALPQMAEDPSRMIDFVGLGPEAPHGEAALRRFFGE